MKTTVTDITETRKALIVVIDGEESAQEEQRLVREFSKQARIPGFRQGKTPESVIRQRFRKQIREELNRVMRTKVYDEVIEGAEFRVYSIVRFDTETEIEPGEETTLEIVLDVEPDFELPNYKGIEVKLPSTDVSDEEIEEAIDSLRRDRAEYAVVERAAEKGDFCRIFYEGFVDGIPIEDLLGEESQDRVWARQENTWEEADPDAPGAEYGVRSIIEALAGHSAGDTFEVSHSFEPDFRIDALQGKEGSYKVELREVRERRLPELNDEFAQSLEAESLEDLRSQVLDQLEKRKESQQVSEKRNQISEYLGKAVEFPLPETGVEDETQEVMGRIMLENMQRGVSEEVFEQNKDEFFNHSESLARRDLKLQIILNRIAREESIEVTDDDMSRAIINMAIRERRAPEDLVKELRRNRSRVFQIQRDLRLHKTLEFLGEKASVSISQEAVPEA